MWQTKRKPDEKRSLEEPLLDKGAVPSEKVEHREIAQSVHDGLNPRLLQS